MDGELPFSMLDVIALLNLPYPPSGRASYNINCPCCDTHNKKHLNINLVKNAFCCPKCGFSGGMLDLYGFYAKMDRSKAYRAILEKLQLDSQTVKMERARKKQQAAVNEYPLTGIEERDATYRAFLNRLSLASDHRANLMERGLNDEVIQQNLYRTTPAGGYEAIAKQLLLEGHYLAGVPGFTAKRAYGPIVEPGGVSYCRCETILAASRA